MEELVFSQPKFWIDPNPQDANNIHVNFSLFFAFYDQSYINDLLRNDNMHEDAHLPCRQSF